MSTATSTSIQVQIAPLTVIHLHGKQLVAGLFWQPLTRPRTYLQEAREIGQRDGMAWFVLQRSAILQAGFANSQQAVRHRTFSLAAVLARKLGRCWLGVFALENGRYALVAVNDGAVIPGCDITGDKQAIHTKLDTVYRHFCWESTYFPADFGYSGEHVDLKSLLKSEDFKHEDYLRPLAFNFNTKIAKLTAIAFLFLLMVDFAYLQWQKQHQRLHKKTELSQQAQQNIAVKNQLEQQEGKPSFARPWTALPLAEDFLTHCVRTIQAMPLVIGGWVFDAAKCNSQIAAATYRRRGNATADDFLDDAQRYFKDRPTFYQQEETAVIQIHLDLKEGGDEILQPQESVLASFSSNFQALGIPFTLTEKNLTDSPLPLLPGQLAPEAETKPDWRAFTFALSTDLTPNIVFSNLTGKGIRGIRLTELGINLPEDAAQLSWHIAGEIYAK